VLFKFGPLLTKSAENRINYEKFPESFEMWSSIFVDRGGISLEQNFGSCFTKIPSFHTYKIENGFFSKEK
jgi:hypothetical protein